MGSEALAAYTTFAFIFAATPGSTTAVVIHNTLLGGRRRGLAVAAGAAVANSAYATAAGLGLGVVVKRLPWMFVTIRMAGAGYLAWLGLASLWRAIARRPSLRPVQDAVDAQSHGREGFRAGLAVNLFAPATLSFYVAAVPSFMPPGAGAMYFALLAAIHVILAALCHSMWATTLHHARGFFTTSGPRIVLDTLTGVALIWLAMRIFLRSA